jgi:glycosyltransferase involved in cell wall biosynthesis
MQITRTSDGLGHSKPTLTVVIPVYNEEEGVAPLCAALDAALQPIANYTILFVDDGSSDGTGEAIEALADNSDRIKYIVLSKNFGHQTALRAGLEHADADCVVTMDGDFQHPPEFIPEMIDQWRQGAKVVLTRRFSQKGLGLFKRWTSDFYYKFINTLSDVKLEQGAADFRLIDRSVLTSLKKFTEHDIFYRGVIPLVGFSTVTLDYHLQDRRFGSSKYSLRKMLRLGIKGVLSSSVRPLRIAMAGAFVVFACAVIYSVFVLISFLGFGTAISGWTSVILTLLILGATQLFVLGIIGEYVGQLLIESRRRPSYFVARSNL